MKVLIAITFLALVATIQSNEVPVLGGITPITGDRLTEAEQELSFALTTLSSGEGPRYRLSKIRTATAQVVSGIAYTYDAELIADDNTTVDCTIKLWSQPWMQNGNQITFNCNGQDEVVKSYTAKQV